MKKIILTTLLLSGCGYSNAYKDIHDLQASQQRQNEQIAALQAQSAELQALIQQLLATTTASEASMAAVQATVNSLAVDIAELQGYTHVTEVIDPCGDAPGKIDEVLLKLSSGEILASFSDSASGLNTRFAVVPAGNYRTTDGTNCLFSVSSSGMVTF